MQEPQITAMAASPYFELEDFMNFAKESRISSYTWERLMDLWESWKKELKASRIQASDRSWLILWLPEEVEQTIDNAWNESPSRGFLMGALAQYMCMSAVGELIPQTAEGGCAPLPPLETPLRLGLQNLNLLRSDALNEGITRRYAVLTYYPFKGGCENCELKEQCPKLKSAPNLPTYILPGHERATGD